MDLLNSQLLYSRLKEKDSFFFKVDLEYRQTGDIIQELCQCADPKCLNVTAGAVAGPFAKKEFTQTAAILAKLVNATSRKKRRAEQLTLSKREVIQYDWPTRSNITKDMAEEKCKSDLDRSFVAQACKQEGFIREVDPHIIEACVEDIKVSRNIETFVNRT